MRCNRRSTACPAGSGACCASAPTRIFPPAPRSIRSEVDETAALIDFVAVCRTYASELAINEVTLRTYSDLQQYVEQSTEALVQSLRGGDGKARAYRQMQVKAAIRFCEVLFGHDYASLMSRAAENAVTGERKPATRRLDRAALNLVTGNFSPATGFSVSSGIVNCRACRRWCKAAHRRRPIGPSPAPGTCLMTLWFVFALMTAAAIFAVLWPLAAARGRRRRQ